MSKSDGSGKFLLGLISGAMAGSLFALFYAPDSGDKLRDKLSYHLNNYLDELGNLIERLNKEKQIISDAKKQGNLVVKDAEEKAESLIKEAEDLLKTINEAKKNSA